MACRIGIDTGGTFTDIVLVDEASGEIATVKIASTPGDPARAVLDGLAQLGRPPASIDSIVLGTTITTNAVLQRRGARVLYLATAASRTCLSCSAPTSPIPTTYNGSGRGRLSPVATPSASPSGCAATER